MSYVVTHSGALVSPESGVPTLRDIAFSLSRVPRFGGYSRRPWTVAHHSLVVAEIAGVLAEDRPAPLDYGMAYLSGLLHDAHEALTGDIPTPFKTDDTRTMQNAIDHRIMAAYFPGGFDRYNEYHGVVACADHRALLAEALFVGPACLTEVEDIVRHFGAKPDPEDMEVVDYYKAFTPASARALWGRQAKDYITNLTLV